ncbi:MAG: phosphatidylglycerol lysyltransferase domain-containing protein [Erysipelotrichaceae bacterium]|nr:phosphatidylglycerol lysyltransferase domain-containing protein [Erysipelotrichaceae bacterium]MDY5252941.1 phosphatidylglycerol lysyltransferase domain-containing protein [Erysipelotrichaceae bacterium]
MSIVECLNNDFTVIDMSNIMMIQDYLNIQAYEESNHNLVNMILWMKWYPLFYYKEDDYLLLLGVHENKMFIYMPLCKDEYFAQAIYKAKSIFDRYHTKFMMSCFVEKQKDMVREILPTVEVEAVRESFDYVYDNKTLQLFKGKKLQKKRNHLNAFYKLYDGRWQYEVLSKDNVDECISFLDKWGKANKEDFLLAEVEGVKRVLMLIDDLNYRGGLIRIDGEVKAFAIGSRLSNRMWQENVEKADDSYRGLYQAMLQQLILHEFAEYELVNREDDLGIENLRHAKEAYNPKYLISKYMISEV